MLVIHPFESINVDENNGQRSLFHPRVGKGRSHRGVKRPAVEEPGERIARIHVPRRLCLRQVVSQGGRILRVTLSSFKEIGCGGRHLTTRASTKGGWSPASDGYFGRSRWDPNASGRIHIYGSSCG